MPVQAKFSNNILCQLKIKYQFATMKRMKDFNDMSTCLKLFHARKLRNHVHHMFICTFFTFFVFYVLLFCTQFNWIGVIFKQIYLTIDGTLVSTTTLSQNEPGTNVNEGVLHTPQNWNCNHLMKIIVQSRTWEVSPFCQR